MALISISDMTSRLVYYLTDDYWDQMGDPRTHDLPFVSGGIWQILTVMTGYLLVTRKLLPVFMANRSAYDMRRPMFIYNIVMVAANAYLFVEAVGACELGRVFLNFKYPDQTDRSVGTMRFLSIEWLFWMTRFLDLLDTVFFVLRKKDSQITFLHLYHHTVVPILCWLCLKVNPKAPIVLLFGICNTLIHVIMYTYYGLASFGPAIQRYLWWKKYITVAQIIQFAICGTYGVVLYFMQTGYPMSWFVVAVGQNPLFFFLFYDFYRQTYRQKKRQIIIEKKQHSKSHTN
ncbi:elongation of very long chain fatty acids protein AAEL008004-like [Oppia nitens]|uniref:elongation of very long chain fatty acids protein AAEL008004-like n=1 Tax=Oppia nitens TaxID=1686743 RepID=UPI0023DAB3B1|nr:elongation of very long chain fatty acids protein AAEL008004-like [Oppia nitens]